MTRAVAALAAALLVVLVVWAGSRATKQKPAEERTAQVATTSTGHDASRASTPPGAPQVLHRPVEAQPGPDSDPPSSAVQAVPTPMSFIRRDYESEPRAAGAAAVERRIREIFATTPDAHGVLRDVRCTRSVCRLDARWSPQLNTAYNAALLVVMAELSREVSFEPGGTPDGSIVPMALFVRRQVPDPSRQGPDAARSTPPGP